MENNKLKIVHLASWYPHDKNPFLGNFVKRHIESIETINSCYTISLQPGNTNNTVNENNSCIFYFSSYSYKLIAYIKLLFHLIKYCKQNKIQIIHVHVTHSLGILAYLTKIILGIPYVVSEHWSVYQPYNYKKKSNIFKLLTQLIIKNSAAMLPVSKQMGEQLKKININAKIHDVGNVVDTQLFFPKNKEKNDKTKFIHISTLDNDAKNISGILNAIKKVSEKNQLFSFTFVAETETAYWQNLVNEIGIKPYVNFKNALSSQAIANELQTHDAFVLFSNYEGQPCVLLESIACGTPVITTNVGGIPEFVNADNGILIMPKDENTLVNSMLTFINNPLTFDREKMHNHIKNNFSINIIAQKFNTIYKLNVK